MGGYTASALSYMLENLAKPVIVTGSQLPFFQALSDGRRNFLGAVVFASLPDVAEVCVYFGDKLLRGCRTSKTDSACMHAFTSPNYPELAEIGTDIKVYHSRLQDFPRGRFRMQPL